MKPDPTQRLVRALLQSAAPADSAGQTGHSAAAPLGILYPPAYASLQPDLYDHLELQCAALGTDMVLRVSLRFLQAIGHGRPAIERRVEAPAIRVAGLAGTFVERAFQFDPQEGARAGEQSVGHTLRGYLCITAERSSNELARVTVRVRNRTGMEPFDDALPANTVFCCAFLSTHVILRVTAGRFIGPNETEDATGDPRLVCRSVNTCPVIATAAADALIGAAIRLPGHRARRELRASPGSMPIDPPIECVASRF